ncbi:MAG: hypothetical protein RL128_734, partial [Pseudomonadota bacterium]
LSSFNAFRRGKGVQLEWTTEQELNALRFVVERSTNGRRWDSLLVVAANGNSNTAVQYQVYDALPLAGECFYRLKQVDEDGRRASAQGFAAWGRDDVNLGVSRRTTWLRLQVANPDDAPRHWVLDIGDALIEHVTLHQQGPDGPWQTRTIGTRHPWAGRDMPIGRLVFTLTQPPRSQGDVLVQIESGFGQRLAMRAWDAASFQRDLKQGNLLRGLYLGLLLSLGAYHLMLWGLLRQPAYLAYTALLASTAASQALFWSIGPEWLWPDGSAWTGLWVVLGFAGAVAKRVQPDIFGIAPCQPRAQGRAGRGRKRYQAFLIPFAADQNHLGVAACGGNWQPDKLGHPHACGIKQFHQSCIAQPLAQGAAFGARRVQKPIHLVMAQGFGQALRRAGARDAQGRIVGAPAFVMRKAEQLAYGRQSTRAGGFRQALCLAGNQIIFDRRFRQALKP